MEIHGECDPQFSKVKETFKKLYQETGKLVLVLLYIETVRLW